jgi:hypothetical protein
MPDAETIISLSDDQTIKTWKSIKNRQEAAQDATTIARPSQACTIL